ncbi:polysaccharide pyruvyl transferase family protein [Oceanicoccus sp. KOV_DT_Chl]|uniref:polysaccharide pyruvyl transferase family protein n=1 Tax=Oceanicoccus sp. KOV_DT_Chl TaxID=1904639 RepID=UPI000C7C65A2|nr:polysaccharide pyruvyl transferase family protein [Oceanicoccus sp. KOV_DT_Chl]
MRSIINAVEDIVRSYQSKPWPLVKPRVIQFPVNDICNARCQMCEIWKQKLDTQISVEQLSDALKNDLFTDVRSVGLNGGEPTLRKDLPELVEVLYKNLPQLKTISLITNALVSKKVIASIDAVGEMAQRYAGNLDVMISLDGVGDVHDLVRGRPGNFENAEKVLAHAKHSRAVASYQLACTVIKDNVYGLYDLLDYAIAQDVHIKYRLAVPHQRLYTDNVTEPFALNFQEKYDLCIFLENLIQEYEESEPQRFFYRSLIDQIMYQEPRKAGCNWQHRGITLSARGELMYCAVESDVLGSVIDQDSSQLYFSNAPHLHEILQSKCDNCKHDYGGIPPGNEFLKQCTIEVADRLGLPLRKFIKGEALVPIGQVLRQAKLLKQQKNYGLDKVDPKPAQTFSLLSKDEPRQVMICGWYGTETLGDKAILGGVVHSLCQTLPDVEICLVSLDPYISDFTCQQMPELSGIKVIHLQEALTQVSQMDLLLFGGGPLMAVNAILDMLALFQRAACAQVPTILSGCGVGPLGSKLHNRYIERILSLSSIRLYRDEKSKAAAAALGVNTRDDIVTEDPAHVWLRSRKSAVNKVDTGEKYLILGLREWPHQQYSNYSEQQARVLKKQYEEQLLLALGLLVKDDPKLRIIPFPMCTNHHGGDDRWYYRRLFSGNNPLVDSFKDCLDTFYLTHEVEPQQACTLFAGADAVLAMRFHSMVFAIEMQSPVLVLDYTLGQGKVSTLAKRMKIPHLSLEEITAQNIADELKAMLSGINPSPVIPLEKDFSSDFQQALLRLQVKAG